MAVSKWMSARVPQEGKNGKTYWHQLGRLNFIEGKNYALWSHPLVAGGQPIYFFVPEEDDGPRRTSKEEPDW